MRLKHLLLGLLGLISLGCMTTMAGVPVLTAKPRIISTDVSSTLTRAAISKAVPRKATLTPFQPVTNTPSLAPTKTLAFTQTPSRTNTPRPTSTRKSKPTIAPTSEWVFHEAGPVTAPIIFYHHVSPGDPPNVYTVSIETFTEQMDYLQSSGYTPIPISLLVKAIREGANLPDRPIVITFDDGNADIYENAFPIMQKYGFTGTLYIVMNYLNHDTFLSADQAIEMYNAGWEIGSHSMDHPNLADMQNATTYEVVNSKLGLVDAIGAPVDTFAYPYGETDADITAEVKKEYTAAVGLGNSYTHSLSDIYYLQRIEISSDMDINAFANMLPW